MSIAVQTERMLTDRFALLSMADFLGEQLGRCTKVDLGVAGDVQTTLRAPIPLLRQKAEGRHLDASLQHYHRRAGASTSWRSVRAGARRSILDSW